MKDVMKAASRPRQRPTPPARVARAVRSPQLHDAVRIAEERFISQQLPLSLAPYRLQAADRWWRESGAPADVPRKRHS